MSGYPPRRGPNMNQYIANLNTIQPASDASPAEPGYPNLDDELSLFTNVEFLNEFDLGESVDGSGDGLGANGTGGNGPNDGTFDDGFFNYVPPFTGSQPANDFAVQYPLASGHPGAYPPPTPTSAGPVAGDKRPASVAASATTSSPDANALEAHSRAAAEEDKRRRNTAASARFRVKKKQREQALERTAKEMTDRAEKLEARITELEQENKFLRGLVVEKASGPAAGAETDVANTIRRVAADSRKTNSTKKGVGTSAATNEA